MRRSLLLAVCALLFGIGRAAGSQPEGCGGAKRCFENRYTRPLAEVLAEVGGRFGVTFDCKGFAADTVTVAWPEARIRPYSLGESLNNLLVPLDLKWRRAGERKIRIERYEYYRRTPDDGRQLLAWLEAQAPDSAAWEARRAQLLDEVRAMLDLEPWLAACAARPKVLRGGLQRFDGYTVQNYALETLPGLYVCGSVYAPAAKGGRVKPASRPLILSPSGHWEGGRYRADQQYRMATFARMGAVAVDMDIVGWGESELQIGREAHTTGYSMRLQAMWSKAVLAWILAERSDLDPARIAVTGGSGGATHALLLAVTDERIAVAAPVVHLVSHFDGGCACESGVPVTWAAGGSCTTEILAAAMAPRPVLTVSDGGDWTATYPELEYPFLRRIWSLCGDGDAVRNVHFPDERHDYGPNKRAAVYDFFAATLGMDAARADESRVTILPEAALQSFGGELPEGAVASRQELEALLNKLNLR